MDQEKVDPKYLGIPNIQFSLIKPNDEREELFKKQRIERGFDDSELWSLDCTIAKFILPRLKRFKERYVDSVVDDSNLIDDIDKMIIAFELAIAQFDEHLIEDLNQSQFKEGIQLFADRFLQLWW
jgi:hypothetical protein